MSESWRKAVGSDVQVGDVVKTASGMVVRVSRIETGFLGRPALIALIEDTPERWFKQPVGADAEVEIQIL